MEELTKEKKWCVYIHTSPSGKKYVGITSQNPIGRWGKDGRGYLGKNKNGEFRQPAMANAVIKYSNWDEWQHDIVATGLILSEAKQMEQTLIAQYKCDNSNYGYNISPGGEGSPLSEKTKLKLRELRQGTHASDDARLNMSIAQKHRWDENKDEKDKRSKQYSGDGNPMYGVHRYGELNPMFGKTHSDDVRQKIREAKRGKNNPCSKIVVCLETGVIYDSAGEAERETGVMSQNILKCCNHIPHRKTAGGFHWKFYDEYINAKEGFICVS